MSKISQKKDSEKQSESCLYLNNFGCISCVACGESGSNVVGYNGSTVMSGHKAANKKNKLSAAY